MRERVKGRSGPGAFQERVQGLKGAERGRNTVAPLRRASATAAARPGPGALSTGDLTAGGVTAGGVTAGLTTGGRHLTGDGRSRAVGLTAGGLVTRGGRGRQEAPH